MDSDTAARLVVSRQQARLSSQPRQWLEMVFWVGMLAAALTLPDRLLLLNQILISCLFALSLDLLLGYAGIVSLGHAAFFGVGAYTAGLLTKAGWQEPISALLASALIAGLFGFLCSLVLARLATIAMFTVTLGIGLLLYEFANKFSQVTGGEDGLQGIVINPLLGRFEFDFYGHTSFWYSFVVTFALYCMLRRLVQTPFGLSLVATRENPRRVSAIGISVRHRVIAAFTISAAIAGVAGALLTQTTQFVALEVLSFGRSGAPLFMIIMGGTGTLVGALVGGVTYIFAQDRLAALSPTYWYFWLGLILIAIVLLGRGGVVGWLERTWASFQRRRDDK